jgi:hypothetical protein
MRPLWNFFCLRSSTGVPGGLHDRKRAGIGWPADTRDEARSLPCAPSGGLSRAGFAVDVYWDLIETIAWIVHRNLKAVRAERRRWRLLAAPRPDEVERARRRRPGRLLSVWDRPHLFFRREGGQALAELNRRYAEGTIYADGRRELFGPRLPIPPLEWADLVPSVTTANLPADALVVTFADADARYGVAADKPAWRDVRFRVADVMREFPPKPTPAEHKPTPAEHKPTPAEHKPTPAERELWPDPRSWPEPESRPEPWPGPEPETTSASKPKREPPKLGPLAKRIVAALREKSPRGRWASIPVMVDDLRKDDRFNLRIFSERTFKQALAFLVYEDPETWKERS